MKVDVETNVNNEEEEEANNETSAESWKQFFKPTIDDRVLAREALFPRLLFDECCICFEHQETATSCCIISKKHTVCGTCFPMIKASGACPLCRGDVP